MHRLYLVEYGLSRVLPTDVTIYDADQADTAYQHKSNRQRNSPPRWQRHVFRAQDFDSLIRAHSQYFDRPVTIRHHQQ